MSVVNQMLKDLEDRQADENGVSAVYQPSAKTKKFPIRWLIVALLVLLLVAMLGWLLLSKPLQITIAQPTESEEAPAEITPVKPMVVRSEPTEPVEEQQETAAELSNITSVTISESAATLEGDIEPEPITEDIVESGETLVAVAPPSVPTRVNEPAKITVVASTSAPPEPETSSVFSKQSAAAANDTPALRDQALAAVRAGQDQLAIQLLEQLIAQEPSNTAARKKLAALLFAQDQAVRARVVLDAGIQLYPQDASMRLMLARLLKQQQQVAAAFTVLNTEVPLPSVSAEFLGVRASMADQLAEYDVAHADYLRLTQLQPDQARWWLGLAIASERINASAQALTAYQQAASMNQLSRDVQRFVQQRISLLVGNQ